MAGHYIGERRRRSPLLLVVVLVVLLVICSRYIASTLIDYAWWSELKQVNTWVNLLLYGTGPLVLAIVLFYLAFFLAFRLGLRNLTDAPLFGILKRSLVIRVGALALALLAIGVANATVDSWTVVRYFGGLRLAPSSHEYVDPIFGKPLQFYFFALPFYNILLHVVLIGAIVSLLIYWLSAHGESFARRMPSAYSPTESFEFERPSIRDAFNSQFVRLVVAIFLVALAVKFYLNRFNLLLQDHGLYLVGVDWVAEHLVLPLQWLMIAGALAAALLILARRGRLAFVLLLILPVRYLLPSIVASLYVRPNELALERPYIEHHIAATRSAYGLNQQVRETTLEAVPEIPIDYAKHKSLLDNVRLWDWRAFHDTVSQIQPLRPYIYMDTDVDRYTIDGQLRQVLVSPRELDIRQLGEARNRWINPHLVYTHGYGLVMAEANRITPDGLPVLFIKNAPVEVTTRSLRVNKPEIYYGEIAHEPVFVDTAQEEFNFPSGSESVYTRYTGGGGFPVSPLVRLASALEYGDFNILLTSYLNSSSRMLIRRPILQRLSTLAGFLAWDTDPYLVVTGDGHLVWMADGYMSSEVHPYSREIELPNGQLVNYIRNSVKATIDADSGETNLYVFDSGDVLIQAYSKLFPGLFKPASAMPADLRAHARYPETLFRAQAEIYRTFHMRDAESFYNRADFWDLARVGNRSQSDGSAATASPTYVVASLPGEDRAEFLLITAFTPANKDNLIGFMSARCDGEHLGELVFQQLSKQNIIYGPMQIDARVNQDQIISKDLSLWNQQGSQVLRGQTLVLPIENSFLYVEPIYIQASQASMPQLKKVALAMGNRLAYADTYEQALSQLIDQLGTNESGQPATQNAAAGPTTPASSASQIKSGNAAAAEAIRKLQDIRDHLQRYRELTAQGKSAEAGKELDDIQKLVVK